jgi:hypothetical protein
MSKEKLKVSKRDLDKSLNLLLQILDNFEVLKGNLKIIDTFYQLSLNQKQEVKLYQFIISQTLPDLESELLNHESWLCDLFDSLKNITSK